MKSVETDEMMLKRLRGKALSGRVLAKVQAALLTNEELWRRVGDLDQEVRTKALAVIENDSVKHESALVGIDLMRKGLLNDGASDIERIAAEQILTCWVQTAVSGYRLESLEPSRETGRDARFWERRHELAQGRLMRSIDMLARLRRLKLVGGKNEEEEPSDEQIHGIKNVVCGNNRDKIFCVRSFVCPPGSKHKISTTVYRGDGWKKGIDDVEKVWDSEKKCMVEVPYYWSTLEKP